ncbi:MAG: ATP-binding protein, partial [Fibrobacteres bacterium]|nr:ATP-binding protein [Fibrobacterota bacterium]
MYFNIVQSYLAVFPCVVILGPRQCGKTTLLKSLPEKWQLFDLEKRSDFLEISRDPDLFFREYSEKIAIDEAQLCQTLFPALRVAIDSNRNKRGRFVITGSSSPELLHSVSESLAGRVGVIEMAPFSFLETESRMESNFFTALKIDSIPKRKETLLSLVENSTFSAVKKYWIRGGYPEPWLSRKKHFHEIWMENYIKTYVERDIAKLFPSLDKVKFTLFVELLANLSGTVINYSDVARALGVSQPTIRDYFEIAHGTFIWRTIPSYEKHAIKRIVKHPKGYLRDSGLCHHFLHLRDWETLKSHPKMGASWESMVIEEILRG